MTEPRPKGLLPRHGDYGQAQNVKEDLHRLFREAQPKRGRIFKATPLAHEVDEGELVWLDDEVSVLRLYVKLNGTLRFVNLT